jgi:hypothetical protein
VGQQQPQRVEQQRERVRRQQVQLVQQRQRREARGQPQERPFPPWPVSSRISPVLAHLQRVRQAALLLSCLSRFALLGRCARGDGG